MANRVVLYKSGKKAIGVILIGVLLAVAGWLFLRYTGKEVIGWSFIILSGLCLILGAGTWMDKKPVLILTTHGITDLGGIRQEIEWDAILRADESFYRGQYFVRLLLDRNYKPQLVRPTWFLRFDRLYEREGLKAIFIRTGMLEVNAIKLCRFIDKMVKSDPARRAELLDRRPAEW